MGQHNEEVLTQTLGYSTERVAETTRRGIMRCADGESARDRHCFLPATSFWRFVET